MHTFILNVAREEVRELILRVCESLAKGGCEGAKMRVLAFMECCADLTTFVRLNGGMLEWSVVEFESQNRTISTGKSM